MGDKSPSDDVCHESAGSLNPMSLLDLPIITDISQDVEVTKMIATTQSDQPTTSVAATVITVESLVQDNYVLIEHGTEDAHPKEDTEHPVLWGCKQCDFRFVRNTYTYNINTKDSFAI